MVKLTSLFVGLAAATTASANPWESKCLTHCAHENKVLDKLFDACEPYRYVLPRPKVYRKCKIAFDAALQATCPRACVENAHGLHIQNSAAMSCKHEKNETPRPVSHDACTQGYHAGAQAAVSYAAGLRTKHEDAMAGGADDTAAQAEAVQDAAAAAQAAVDAAKAAEAAQAAAAAAAAQSDEAKKKAAAKDQAEAEVAAEAAKAAELDAARVAARAAYESSSKKAAEEKESAAAAKAAAAEDKEAAAAKAVAAEPQEAAEEGSSLRGGDTVAAE